MCGPISGGISGGTPVIIGKYRESLTSCLYDKKMLNDVECTNA
jgi:hypothetical protein